MSGSSPALPDPPSPARDPWEEAAERIRTETSNTLSNRASPQAGALLPFVDNSPPTIVISTGMCSIWSTGTVMKSSPKTARSAFLPRSIDPRVSSSAMNRAAQSVFIRSAVGRSTAWSRPPDAPLGVSPADVALQLHEWVGPFDVDLESPADQLRYRLRVVDAVAVKLDRHLRPLKHLPQPAPEVQRLDLREALRMPEQVMVKSEWAAIPAAVSCPVAPSPPRWFAARSPWTSPPRCESPSCSSHA